MTVMLSPGDLPGIADGIDNAVEQLAQGPDIKPTQATGFRESGALSNGLKIVGTYLDRWHGQVVDTVRYRAALVELAGKWFAEHEDASAEDIRTLTDQALKQSSPDGAGRPGNPPAR